MPHGRLGTWPILLGFGVTGLFVLYQSDRNRKRHSKLFAITSSPLTTVLPKLSKSQLSQLAYQPDHVPGARDVVTPFGNTRVYEFGPEDGQKVLLVHGISTPCLSLAGIAKELVNKGCRVMLFDLYGRGYSDNPIGHAHTKHLYISQILSILASSKLSWTSQDGFHLIGYSLGGGIAASFTRYFPQLVTSLVLIAPSGLLRQKHIAWQSYALYRTGGILPEPVVRYLVQGRLHNPKAQAHNSNGDFLPEDAMVAELDSDMAGELNTKIDSAVQWQLENHDGFLDAFISCIRYAPITDQHHTYRTIGSNILTPEGRMVHNKVVLVLGEFDSIILADEVEPDMRDTIGKDRLHTIKIDAGHDVAITKSSEIVAKLWSFWTSS